MRTKALLCDDYPKHGLPLAQRKRAMVSAMIALFMSVLDINIVNIVLPELAKVFEVSDSIVIWVVNGYQLAIISTLLIFSFLGEIFGYNRIFLFGVFLFIVSSFACSFCRSFYPLLIFRFVQGLGASAIASVNQAQIKILYPSHLLGKGVSISAIVVAVSSAAGPTIAGSILSLGSWHFLFLLNVPIGLVAILMGYSFLPRIRKRRTKHIDRRSVAYNILFFGSFVLLFEHLANKGSMIAFILYCLFFLFIGASYIRRQKRLLEPLFPVDLLRKPIFANAVLISILAFVANMSALVCLPFLLINRLHFTPIGTGLLLSSWPICTIVTAPIAGKLVQRLHPGKLSAAGLFVFLLGLFSLASITHVHPASQIVWRLAFCGAGFGLYQTPNNACIMSSAPRERNGGASGMLGIARLTGQTMGATMVALIFNYVARDKDTTFCFYISSLIVVGAILLCWRSLSFPSPMKRVD